MHPAGSKYMLTSSQDPFGSSRQPPSFPKFTDLSVGKVATSRSFSEPSHPSNAFDGVQALNTTVLASPAQSTGSSIAHSCLGVSNVIPGLWTEASRPRTPWSHRVFTHNPLRRLSGPNLR